jgi:hypothetical protein
MMGPLENSRVAQIGRVVGGQESEENSAGDVGGAG